MYIIQYVIDNRHYIVDEKNVLCDEKVVKNGDIVAFMKNKIKCTGTIIIRSSNTDFLKKEAKRLNKVVIETETEAEAGASVSSVVEPEIGNKRKRTPKKQWSDLLPLAKQPAATVKPPPLKTMRTKKSGTPTAKTQDSSSGSSTSSETTDDELNTKEEDEPIGGKSQFTDGKKNDESLAEVGDNPEKSPSKEELKQMLAKYRSLVENSSVQIANDPDNNNSKKCSIPKKSNSTEDIQQLDKHINDGGDDDQLLGPDFIGDKMVNIGNNVFCKDRILKSAVGSSHKATHLARRLLQGVFKHEALMSCTISGQAPRAQGKERQKAEVSCLNERAKQAIMDFALEKATDKGWIQQTKAEIKREMGQKLGEYKREHKKGL